MSTSTTRPALFAARFYALGLVLGLTACEEEVVPAKIEMAMPMPLPTAERTTAHPGPTTPPTHALSAMQAPDSKPEPAAAVSPDDEALLRTKIEPLFSEFNRSNAPGAAVLVMQDDRVIFAKGYGLADVAAKRPITPATIFRLASITKQLTAMCVMILAERGKLAYDDPIQKYVAGLPRYAEGITVRQLLNHTSGLPDYGALVPENQLTQVHDRDVLALLKGASGLESPPGARYKYSNTGYVLLGLLVESASGQPLPSFLKETIFEPLGMSGSIAPWSAPPSVPERAYGYAKREGEYALADQSATSAVLGDGGIYSSVEDLSKWISALLNDRLVKRDTMQKAWTGGALRDGTAIDYGFGWYLEDEGGIRHPYHTGTSIGFRNVLYLYPEQRFAVIILTNRNDAAPQAIARMIASMFIPELSWSASPSQAGRGGARRGDGDPGGAH